MNKQMERLYLAAQELKNITSPSDLARALNASPQTIKNWESRGISKQGLLDAQRVLGVSAQWIEAGDGTMTDPNQMQGSDFELWSSSAPLSDDYVHIPFYKDVMFKAGSGCCEIEDYNGFSLPFAKASLYRSGVNPNRAACFTVRGNSMEPVLRDGTTIGVNLESISIKDGEIYAFRHDDLFRIKILYRLPGNKVKIKSYNTEEYEDEIDSLENIHIIGEVFWWSFLK